MARVSRSSSVSSLSSSCAAAPPPPPSFPDVLNASQVTPFLLSVSHRLSGGKVVYSYRFVCTPGRSPGQYNGACEISYPERTDCSVAMKASFRLFQTSAYSWVLVCNQVNGKRVQVEKRAASDCVSSHTEVPISIAWNRRLNSWVGIGTYTNGCAVFTIDGFTTFGTLAAMACTEMSIIWSATSTAAAMTTGTMTLTCYGPGGVILNSSQVEDPFIEDEEDDKQGDGDDSVHGSHGSIDDEEPTSSKCDKHRPAADTDEVRSLSRRSPDAPTFL